MANKSHQCKKRYFTINTEVATTTTAEDIQTRTKLETFTPLNPKSNQKKKT